MKQGQRFDSEEDSKFGHAVLPAAPWGSCEEAGHANRMQTSAHQLIHSIDVCNTYASDNNPIPVGVTISDLSQPFCKSRLRLPFGIPLSPWQRVCCPCHDARCWALQLRLPWASVEQHCRRNRWCSYIRIVICDMPKASELPVRQLRARSSDSAADVSGLGINSPRRGGEAGAGPKGLAQLQGGRATAADAQRRHRCNS
jgi:hypothetical protein